MEVGQVFMEKTERPDCAGCVLYFVQKKKGSAGMDPLSRDSFDGSNQFSDVPHLGEDGLHIISFKVQFDEGFELSTKFPNKSCFSGLPRPTQNQGFTGWTRSPFFQFSFQT